MTVLFNDISPEEMRYRETEAIARGEGAQFVRPLSGVLGVFLLVRQNCCFIVSFCRMPGEIKNSRTSSLSGMLSRATQIRFWRTRFSKILLSL